RAAARALESVFIVCLSPRRSSEEALVIGPKPPRATASLQRMTGSPAGLPPVPALRALDVVAVRVAADEPFAQREGERETGGDDESGGDDPGHGCAPGKRRELIQVSLAPADHDMGRRCHRPTPLSADRLANSGLAGGCGANRRGGSRG